MVVDPARWPGLGKRLGLRPEIEARQIALLAAGLAVPAAQARRRQDPVRHAGVGVVQLLQGRHLEGRGLVKLQIERRTAEGDVDR